MLTSLHHVTLAHRDLQTAVSRFSRLGLEVSPGGRIHGRGQENALVHLQAGYLELMALHDPVAEVNATGARGQVLVDFLARREVGWVSMAMTTTDLDGVAAVLTRRGIPLLGPFEIQRRNPDGTALSWRLILVGGRAWRQRWPLLIEAIGREERPVGQHRLGATGVSGVSLLVRELDTVLPIYVGDLGLTRVREHHDAVAQARRVELALGELTLELVSPTGAGQAADELAEVGEGVYEVTLAVRSLLAARQGLGADLAPVAGSDRFRVMGPVDGARLLLVER